MTNEEYYDQEIAPALLEISKKCKERGFSMVATVEYDKDARGSTFLRGPNTGLEMVMLELCAKAGTNVDRYMLSLRRFCEESGIDTGESIFMRMGR
jgi:hypothetical protein